MMSQSFKAGAGLLFATGFLTVLVLMSGGGLAGDGQIVSDQFSACALPCWQGIVPHSTPAGDARAVLERLYGAEHLSAVGDLVLWHGQDGIEGRMVVDGPTAGTIMLEFPPDTLTVGEWIEQVGPPEFVNVTLPHPRNSPDPAHPQCEVLRLVYPGSGVEVRVAESRSGRVDAEQSVYRVYLSPQRPELTIETPYYAREWGGYGAYCIAVSDIFD